MKTLRCLVLAAVPLVAEWYQGGTLHHSTLKEWSRATFQNRLATSADFATATKPKVKSMNELRVRAVALESCISTVAAPRGKQSIPDIKTTDVAAVCAIQ